MKRIEKVRDFRWSGEIAHFYFSSRYFANTMVARRARHFSETAPSADAAEKKTGPPALRKAVESAIQDARYITRRK